MYSYADVVDVVLRELESFVRGIFQIPLLVPPFAGELRQSIAVVVAIGDERCIFVAGHLPKPVGPRDYFVLCLRSGHDRVVKVARRTVEESSVPEAPGHVGVFTVHREIFGVDPGRRAFVYDFDVVPGDVWQVGGVFVVVVVVLGFKDHFVSAVDFPRGVTDPEAFESIRIYFEDGEGGSRVGGALGGLCQDFRYPVRVQFVCPIVVFHVV